MSTVSYLIPKNYTWGSGFFKDIADIRRRVYTDYYTMVEHGDTMQEILGRYPAEHCSKLLQTIEGKDFDIDSKNYEQIKAFLWQQAKLEFPEQIEKWLQLKDKLFVETGQSLLDAATGFLRTFDLNEVELWRTAVLFDIALNLFDILKCNDYTCVISEIEEMISKEGSPYGINVGIDFFEEFASRVLAKPQNLVVLVGDISTLPFDLKLYGELVIEGWLSKLRENPNGAEESRLLEDAINNHICVTFLANDHYCPRNNNKVVQRNATKDNVKAALLFDGLERLRLFSSIGLFKVAGFSSQFPGTVLTDLGQEALRILEQANSVLSLGEQNNITTNGLRQDCFKFFPIRDFLSIFYTGIKNNSEDLEYPQFAIVYAPAGVLPSINYEPDLKTSLSAKQYYGLFRALPRNTWQELANLTRDSGTSILEVALGSNLLGMRGKEEITRLFFHSQERVMSIAKGYIEEFGGEYDVLDSAAAGGRRRVMHILHFKEGATNLDGEKLKLGLLFAHQVENFRGEPKSRITYNDIIRNVNNVYFGFNFLYFITRNLILKFNEVNPHFILDETFFGEYIGFAKIKQQDRDILFPPLYNKGAVGMKHDGSFVFGRVTMPESGSVLIPIDDQDVHIDWTCVNPSSDLSRRISIFTPMAEDFADCQRRAPHFFGETRAMHLLPENDNYNFVIINDILLGVVRGVTEIPPFGVVLSVPRGFFAASVREFLDDQCKAIDSSRRHVKKFARVRFNIPLPPKWSDCGWIMGGALLMVNEGKVENLEYNPQESRDSVYHLEGWTLDSSQRTQETPVEANLNEARTTIGLTVDNEFFITVIEGRANNRTGATHQQTVDWIQEYFDKADKRIRFALDLDSASSVSLGIFVDDEFRLLNQTARGSDSKLFDTRYYNHLAYLQRV